MGLFRNEQKDLQKYVAKKMRENAKTGTFRCRACGKPQRITYFGSNDAWVCKNCRTKNWIG